ncbi:cobalamin biosynthesis protein CbiM [Beggiatoa sp. PS]|nr:cobalamin biosynthesis protein CbiM [Beggiatoa sp. PS]
MHISEGIIIGLPAVGYTVIAIGLTAVGVKKMKDFIAENPEKKPLLAMGGAFIFLLSLIPIPAFTGTCSHPAGSPLAAILLGPWIGLTLTAMSLFLQAAFFAHGGFSTWGANVITLGIGGAFCGWLAFKAARQAGLSLVISAGIGGLIGDLMTYAIAGFSLSLVMAYGPNPQLSFSQYLLAIYVAYLPTQMPIAIGEMFLTGLLIGYVFKQRPEILQELKVVFSKAVILFAIFIALSIPLVDRAYAEESVVPTIAPIVEPEAAITEEKEEAGMVGMDEAVNEVMAEVAGLSAREPYINLKRWVMSGMLLCC